MLKPTVIMIKILFVTSIAKIAVFIRYILAVPQCSIPPLLPLSKMIFENVFFHLSQFVVYMFTCTYIHIKNMIKWIFYHEQIWFGVFVVFVFCLWFLFFVVFFVFCVFCCCLFVKSFDCCYFSASFQQLTLLGEVYGMFKWALTSCTYKDIQLTNPSTHNGKF